MAKKSHYVLVHGASHGAWCWYKVASLLEAGGHKVTALDMAASGINPMLAGDVRSLAVYTKPLTDFMEGLAADERVVLVSHSLGFMNIILAMETFPHKISLAVFTGASPTNMPAPQSSRSVLEGRVYMQTQRSINCPDNIFGFDDGPDMPPTSILLGPNCLATKLYQMSPPEDLTLGLMLVRPLPLLIGSDLIVTKENYGSVPRVFVVGEKDLALSNWSPEIIDEMIPGADHMVMFSKPHELASYLQDIATSYD